MIFKTLFGGSAKKGIPEEKLPPLHSFVDVTVSGRAARSVSVEELGPRIAVGDTVGRKGERAVFVYQNAAGKFRFASSVLEARAGMTFFEMPQRIETLGGGGGKQKRSSVRLDTLLTGQWRMAPGGKGVGEFMKGSVRDISRGGCALITDRMCKVGQTIEVKLTLNSSAPPLTVLGEVMRAEQVPTSSKYSHGLRFHGVTPVEDRAILDFINRRTTELRNRGLA